MCFSSVGIFIFHHVQKPLMTFWTLGSISGLYMPSKEPHPSRSWFRGQLQSFSPRMCPPGCHVSISLVGAGADRYPQNESRNVKLSCRFPPKTKARCGWALESFYLVWKSCSGLFFMFRVIYLVGADNASCSLCSSWWSKVTCWHTSEWCDHLPKCPSFKKTRHHLHRL